MFMALMVAMVSKVYTCPQTHQVVYIKHVGIFTHQSYLRSVLEQNNKHGCMIWFVFIVCKGV